MKATSVILSAAAILSAASVSAHPVAEPEPVAGNSTVGEVLKRAGATFYTCTTPNAVALTFDDGPWYYMTDIGNAITNAGGKATFFLNGNNWGCIYDFVDPIRAVYAQGHQIASHTWAHQNLATLSWDRIHDEMWRVELALQRIIGAQPAWMRPPYGSFNQLVVDASNVRGQNLAIWDFDSGDANGVPPQTSKNSYQSLVNQHPNTILTLNHETQSSTAYDVLPYAIGIIKTAGYQLVTVAECLGQAPYQWVGTPQTPTADWHC